jgi:heme-degrading monooxygenase HmoA
VNGLYTFGDWYVKPGAEKRFVDAWNEFAEWSAADLPGATYAKLLQDQSDARRFVSFGPWRDEDAVAEWRAHPGFQERVERLQEHLESFSPATMVVAAEVGPATPDPW